MPLSEVSMALKVYPIFSQNKCTHFFQKLIDQGFVLVYIDDILLLAHTNLIFETLSNNYTKFVTLTILKLHLKNHYTFFLLSNFLDMKLATTLLNPSLLKLMAYTN